MESKDLTEAKRVLDIEAKSILDLKGRLNDQFVKAVELICEASGKVIYTGVGKSGHIGRKVASTMSSTGTPSLYIHPTESSHGDLGVISSNDIVVAISYSGEAQEMVDLIKYCARKGVPVIAMTKSKGSTLAQSANAFLDISVEVEACPMNLAPTSSSTATLAMGDALSMAVLKRKGFDESDFAEFHPGGVLGRKMLTRVKDLMMNGDELPAVPEETAMSEVISIMTKYGSRGAAGITSTDGSLIGVITDGDIRRSTGKQQNLLDGNAKDFMSLNPKTIDQNELAQKALFLMEQFRINLLFVIDSQSSNPKKPVGLIHIQDLVRANLK